MEVDLVTSGMSEEDTFEVNDSNVEDGSTFEGERCGICMDVIIDRGVLDCCQHWFCFGCIDNWATITNLCPLCQNEFQLITCVPVYDTIGSNKIDDDLIARDDDWCIEGKNNTLSFPSYYIDENAVICLDGDGCKIRNGSATIEEDSNLDTSIACDSCDIWYHAFCVGFDTESASENTWLCPRCVVDKLPQKSDIVLMRSSNNQNGSENADSECLLQAALSRKVSVSVADAGETAVVVSMVGGNECTEEPSENFLSKLEVDKHVKTETFMSTSVANSSKGEIPLKDKNGIQPTLDAGELRLSLSCDTSLSLPPSLAFAELNTKCPNEAMKEISSPRKLFNEFCIKKEPSESESPIGLHLGLSVGSFLSVDNLNGGTKDQAAGDMLQQQNPSEDKDDKIVFDASKDAARLIGIKRKQTDCSDDVHTSADNEGTKTKIEDHVSIKKTRSERKSQTVPTDQTNVTVSDNSQNCASDRVVSKDGKFKHDQEKGDVTSDIMSIVQGTDCKLSKVERQNPTDKSSKERENAAGLRVKKIMKTAAEDKDSFTVVQKLRKEIRDAVRNKSSKDIGENLFDPELLAAFRAAVAVPKTEPVKKLTPEALKLKKSILQKGKVRENLTKKIYANSSGRRKRAWDRDCEVEFWKHRCMRYTKPEKIETLNSVLSLLRKDSENTEKEESECQTTNPILSRLYLADTSVFPRKDDIKPLSVLKASGSSEENKELVPEEKGSRPSLCNRTAEITETDNISLKVGLPSSDDRGSKNNVPSSKADAAVGKVHPSKRPEGPIGSPLGGSKIKSQKEGAKPEDKMIDKRKWALEILARKNAAAGKNGSHEKQEANAMLKGNYPLLAQLPVDMRPVCAPSRHNKIPISVRQTQLYHLTELFLKKANLPIIRRTADTELAVADAINIEKEVADRSNSKLVYVNLCSQELLHRSENSKSTRATESDPSVASVVPINGSEQAKEKLLTDPQNSISDSEAEPSAPSAVPVNGPEHARDKLPTDPMVVEALQAAGLLFDSPPNSPRHQTEVTKEDNFSINIREEGPDNVFEMDSHPELDIYGDFEYSLDDEDYIGASAVTVSNLQPGEAVPKLKVVFSTLDALRLNESLDSKDRESSEMVELPKESSCTDEGIKSSTMDGTDKPRVHLETSLTEEGEELSIAECEELYGPDKEPLIKRFPEEASTKLHGPMDAEAECKDPDNESCSKNVPATIGQNSGAVNSPNHSQIGENIQRKDEKSNTDSDSKSDDINSVSKKVEAYIKEHIRPLCKSGVITADQYRWAVAKTTEKVMKHHCKAKSANFLIKEGEKVKKLAEQYVEAAQQK